MSLPEPYASLAVRLDALVETSAPKAIALSDELGLHPELAGEEHESSRKMVEILMSAGFEVEYPFMGLDTAFIGRKGKAGKSGRVAVLVEYDALPQLGHACGHNVHGSMSILAALALQPLAEELDAELWVVGTPAEEVDGAKCHMSDEGLFEGVDMAIMIHSSGGKSFVAFRALAMDGYDFVFKGKTAHAASSPWEGLNALNGVRLFMHSLDMLRQHVRPETRIHGVVLDGGMAPNIVPEYARARFEIRAPWRSYLDGLAERVFDCARGAALATGTEVSWKKFESSFDDILPAVSAESMMAEILEEIGIELSLPEGPGGSTDMGNVSYRCPALHPVLAIADGDFPLHTRELAEAAMKPRAHEALVQGARAIGRAVLRTWLDPELRQRMKEDHRKAMDALKSF